MISLHTSVRLAPAEGLTELVADGQPTVNSRGLEARGVVNGRQDGLKLQQEGWEGG